MILNGFLRFMPNFDWVLSYFTCTYIDASITQILVWGSKFMEDNKIFTMTDQSEFAPMMASVAEVVSYASHIDPTKVAKCVSTFLDDNLFPEKSPFDQFKLLFTLQIIYSCPDLANRILPTLVETFLEYDACQNFLDWLSELGHNETLFDKMAINIIINSKIGFFAIKNIMSGYKGLDAGHRHALVAKKFLLELTNQIRIIYLGNVNVIWI